VALGQVKSPNRSRPPSGRPTMRAAYAVGGLTPCHGSVCGSRPDWPSRAAPNVSIAP
jgi:hypothetical protein